MLEKTGHAFALLSSAMKTVVLVFLAPMLAQATLTPSIQRGERVVQINDRGTSEICVIPTHLGLVGYSKKDLANEQGLCALEADVNAAICPKMVSTNPGIEWFEVTEGISIDQAERNMCFIANPKARKENLLKKLAKYKNSTSCSYTPSILAYYHVSRILNGAGRVPPAVLRTFDIERHKEVARIGIQESARKLGSAAVIVKTWQSLLNFLNAGEGSSKKDVLMTDAFDQSYGALQMNPRSEVKFSAMFNAGTDRTAAFRDQNQVFQLVKSSRPVAQLVQASFTAANVQVAQQMKDSSDMAIMDSILSQEDRMGNIHATVEYAYIDKADIGSNGVAKVKFESKLKPEEVALKQAVQIKRMMLKDNDCGVNRSNRAMKGGLVNALAHIDPKTYQGVLWFDSIADQPDVVKSFRSGMMFNSTDYQTMRANLKTVANMLKVKCASGALKLDLDLDLLFSGRSSVVNQCQLVAPQPKLGLDVAALDEGRQ